MNLMFIDTDRSRSFRFLKMQMSLALPLIKAELAPFRDYRCETEAWIEGGLFGDLLTIYTSEIPVPTETMPLRPSTSFRIVKGRVEVIWQGQTCATFKLADLTPNQIAEAYCNTNEPEMVRAFTEICDFHEAKMDDGLPF
jgi:hypothetical protein